MKPFKSTFSTKLPILLALCALILPNPSMADDGLGTLQDLLPQSKSKPARRAFDGRIRLFDHILIHPMPVWSLVANGPAPAERSKFQRSRKENAFRLDVVPKDEDFEGWKSKFSIVAFNNQPVSVIQQANGLAQFFKSQCSPNNLKTFPGNRTETKLVMVVACGNYSRSRESGVMAAVVILRKGDLTVTLMRQWRGSAFRATIQNRWPVSKPEINGVLAELVRSQLLPIKKN